MPILNDLIVDLIEGILAALLLALVGIAYKHRRYIKIATRCLLFSRNKKIRVSMAAILCVMRDNRYILIRNRHRPERFGPIGGVYKYYKTATDNLDRCGFQPQSLDQDMERDLRGFVKGNNLPCFLQWFFSGKNREIEPLTRELTEELQEINLELNPDIIHNLQYEFVKTIFEGLDYIPGVDYLQFRYFGIYKFSPNDLKGNELTEILFQVAESNPNVIDVTAEEIFKRRAASGEVIGTHTGYLITNKRIGPESPPIQ